MKNCRNVATRVMARAAVAASLLLLLTPLRPATADLNPDLVAVEKAIESQLSTAVRSVDPYALVSVNIEAKVASSNLPMTPFQVKDLTLKPNDHGFQVQSVEVLLFLSNMDTSQYLTELSEEMLKGLGTHPKIKAVALPALFVKDAKALQAAPNSPQRGAAQSASEQPRTDFWILGFLVVAFAVYVVLSAFRSRQLSSAIGKLEQRLSESLQNLSDSRVGAGVPERIEQASSAQPRSETGLESGPEGMGLDSLKALLSDAYWTRQDGYAAWVWGRLKRPIREKLLSELPLLKGYTSTLSHLEPRELDFHEDLAYFKPTSLSHVDQSALRKLVLDQPSFYRLLPEIRKLHLDLPLSQRLRLEKADPGSSELFNAATSRMAASPLRAFEDNSPIPVQSLEDEAELLAQAEKMDPALIRRIPTLIWFQALPAEQSKAILERFSARELASAWVGPAALLENLRNLLPKSKGELVASYASSSTPSRTSPAFGALHRQLVETYLSRRADTASAADDPVSDASRLAA